MSEGLDNLLAEAFAKSIFKEEKEEGEIDSGDEKKKSKKSKHKSKSKSKDKHSKAADKKSASNEEDSEVMKLLLSSHLKSYAQIPFKECDDATEPLKSANSDSSHKSADKSSRESNGHKKSGKHSSKKSPAKRVDSYDDEKYYCDDEYNYVRYYESKSNKDHEDYYYGSYYEGSSYGDRSSTHKRGSRPLSPLYEPSFKSSKQRNRSRSPFYKSSSRRRSLSPYDRRKSGSSPSSKSSYYRDRRRSCSSSGTKRKRHERPDYEEIDKERLLEIARENLLKMIEKGDLPKGTDVNRLKLRHLRELTTQKSVQQWTEFCRAISALEAAADFDSDIDSDFDSDDDTRSIKSEHPFTIRHPFKLKERKDIEIKVRDFVQLPSRTATEMAQELRTQFPVSSGNQHRRKELEWHEVEPTPAPVVAQPTKKLKKVETKLETSQSDANKNSAPTPSPACSVPAIPATDSNNDSSENKTESVFPKPVMPIDIGSIMAQRLSAMRKLQADPHNVVALKQMFQSQEMMREWAESKIVPGQFTGSTGANVLTGDQLNGPVNAWTRKDQFKTAAPITDGIGMYLLLKMGWNPGQGLGKHNDGTVDPIILEIKFDKKGLVAEKEEIRNLPLQLVSVPKSIGKHPVSMLHELCAKKKWSSPSYEQVFEQGPDHRKNFMFKVIVNGVEYQPSVSSANKKQARALAAGVCLQAFGLLPKDQV